MDEVTKLTIQNQILRFLHQRLEKVNIEADSKVKTPDYVAGAVREILALIEFIKTQ